VEYFFLYFIFYGAWACTLIMKFSQFFTGIVIASTFYMSLYDKVNGYSVCGCELLLFPYLPPKQKYAHSHVNRKTLTALIFEIILEEAFLS